MVKAILYISNMNCTEKMNTIITKLKNISGIKAMEFNLIQKELIITHTFPNITDLQDSLQSLGMYSQIKKNVPTDFLNTTMLIAFSAGSEISIIIIFFGFIYAIRRA